MESRLEKLSESIKSFEDTYKKYLNSDGTINRDGYKILMSAEYNYADKYGQYEMYHLSPRIRRYWKNPLEDIEYKRAWKIARNIK